MKVIEVKRKQYQEYELVFEYMTDEHYSVNVVKMDNGIMNHYEPL
jgi:hypothetical protein